MGDYTSIISAAVAFVVTVLLGFVVIPYLRKLKFGQTILEEGPTWHKGKQGTPTMGGVMIIAGVLIALAVGFGVSSTTVSSTIVSGTLSCVGIETLCGA